MFLRGCLYAKVQVKKGHHIHLFNTHLCPSVWEPQETAPKVNDEGLICRSVQLKEMLAFIYKTLSA